MSPPVPLALNIALSVLPRPLKPLPLPASADVIPVTWPYVSIVISCIKVEPLLFTLDCEDVSSWFIVTALPDTDVDIALPPVNVKFSPMATPDWVEPSVIPNPNCLKLALSPSPKYNLDELDAV